MDDTEWGPDFSDYETRRDKERALARADEEARELRREDARRARQDREREREWRRWGQ